MLLQLLLLLLCLSATAAAAAIRIMTDGRRLTENQKILIHKQQPHTHTHTHVRTTEAELPPKINPFMQKLSPSSKVRSLFDFCLSKSCWLPLLGKSTSSSSAAPRFSSLSRPISIHISRQRPYREPGPTFVKPSLSLECRKYDLRLKRIGPGFPIEESGCNFTPAREMKIFVRGLLRFRDFINRHQ